MTRYRLVLAALLVAGILVARVAAQEGYLAEADAEAEGVGAAVQYDVADGEQQDSVDEGYFSAEDGLPDREDIATLMNMLGMAVIIDGQDYDDEEVQEDNDDGTLDLAPCMHDVADEEAMMMEGDLTRVFVVPSTPQVMSVSDLFSGFTASPLSEWLDRQYFVLHEMPIALPMSAAPQLMQTEAAPLNYDEDEDTELSLNALASFRFMPAMQELMEAERTVDTTDSGVTEDGAWWTSAEGSTANGHWYSFSMSLSQPEEETDASSTNARLFAEELAERNLGMAASQVASAWDEYPVTTEADLPNEAHRQHASCMLAAAACVAGVFAAIVGIKFFTRRSKGEAGLPAAGAAASSVAQPLLSPLSPERPASAGGAVVIAAHHADLEKHYVDIAYVPLKGEN